MRLSRETLRSTVAKQVRSARRLPRRLSHVAQVGLQVVYWTATFQLRDGLRRRRDARLIRNSGLFDAGFYLAQCTGDPAAESDPVQHYVRTGARRGLDPSPLFDGTAYAEQNPAVAASGDNPLAHFIRFRKAATAGATDLPRPSPAARFRKESPPLGPPFRAAPSPRAVLVFHARIPAPGSDGRVVALLRRLRGLGYPVTLASASEEAGPEEARRLGDLGVAAVPGLDAALRHLAEEGHAYRAVFLSGADQILRFMTAVRAYAPAATVVYDPGPGREATAGRSAFDRAERASAACADVVLVRSAAERDAILRDVPGARVEVLPDLPGAAGGPDVAEDVLASLLEERVAGTCGARHAGADPEQRIDGGASAGVAASAERSEGGTRRRGARPIPSVLVVGVYLCDKENNAAEIMREFERAAEWKVEQRWIALGKSPVPEPLAAVTAWRERSRVPKFVLLNRLLRELDPERHEFVFVCDDDISLPAAFVDRYLDLVTRHDLALAQPARTHDSYIDHWVVERQDGLSARRTRFVEIGPLFSIRKDAARLLTPFDESSPMGWGYDFVWPVIVERAGLRMGIVDATPVAHNMRKPVALYDMRDAAIAMDEYLRGRPHLSISDAFTTLEAYT